MTPLHVVGAGAITPLGFDALRTLASLRSGLDAFGKTTVVGEAGDELSAARIRGYAEGAQGARRYEALAIGALKETVRDVPREAMTNVIFLLGLPRPERAGVPDGLAQRVRDAVCDRLQVPPAHVRVLPAGRVSAYLGVRAALSLCEQGMECVVGGVDSLVDRASLLGLSRERLLKEEWDGFIPGEGAAFVRLSARAASGPWGKAAAQIVGFGEAQEAGDGSAERPWVGVAVNSALRQAARDAGISDSDIGLRINDVNGARPQFEDDAYGVIRFFRAPRPEGYLEVLHPASYLGELGAAAGGVALLWAAATLELGLRGGQCVLTTASDERDRTAAILRAGAGPGRRTAVRAGRDAPVVHPARSAREDAVDDPYGIRIEGLDLGHEGLFAANLDGIGTDLLVIRHHHVEGTAPWADTRRYEDQLVAHADAIGWGGGPARRAAYARLESGEPDEAAAAALALLSFEGERAAVPALVEAARRDGAHAGWIQDACIYAPRPTADALLSAMAADPSLGAGALEAARVAGSVQRETVSAWVERLRGAAPAAVVRAFGWVAAPDAWASVAHLVSRSAGFDWEAMAAALVLGDRPESVLERLGVRRFDDAPLVWILGRIRSGRAVLAGSSADEIALTAEGAEALGWCGEPRARDWLLAALEHGEDPVPGAAARALRLIYGAAPEESAEVTDEDSPEGKRSIKRLSHDPRAWVACIDVGAHPPLRHGERMTPRTPAITLARPELGTRARTIAAWEHVLRTGAPLGFHPRQLIRLQRHDLAALPSQ